MAKKLKVVLFNVDGVKLLTNPEPSQYEGHPKCAIDPDLGLVEGLSPHQWDLRNGRIVPVDLPADAEVPSIEPVKEVTSPGFEVGPETEELSQAPVQKDFTLLLHYGIIVAVSVSLSLLLGKLL